jgi:hypothetical protein
LYVIKKWFCSFYVWTYKHREQWSASSTITREKK